MSPRNSVVYIHTTKKLCAIRQPGQHVADYVGDVIGPCLRVHEVAVPECDRFRIQRFAAGPAPTPSITGEKLLRNEDDEP